MEEKLKEIERDKLRISILADPGESYPFNKQVTRSKKVKKESYSWTFPRREWIYIYIYIYSTRLMATKKIAQAEKTYNI